ncbi:chaperonin [Hyalangium rubrum]|uniref:Chaperonin n=1 Tax=Hyalangium rubrum TaxID=3103134 RepID=A0ABU5H3C7_9BACT|nr:chaperonin [Hyalangium sp. s54d21]MDY7227776.1 chaperonin [Hyalangium sp. s54d21]
MAKAQRRDQVKRQTRQTKVARAKAKVGRSARQVQVTLGDLIAAAFDTVGGEVKKVARVISSPTMTQATGKRVVFVG